MKTTFAVPWVLASFACAALAVKAALAIKAALLIKAAYLVRFV